MTETKPTAGPYTIAHERMILGGDSALIAECPASEVGNRESLANTQLIADAFNVLHETGMGPRELNSCLHKATDLLRRVYASRYRPQWQEGETEKECIAAVNDFLADILGPDWDVSIPVTAARNETE